MRALLGLILLSTPTLAQHHGHHGATPSPIPYAREWDEGLVRMHEDMSVTLSDLADRDFLLGMIPHHQGAIDMARVALTYACTPQVRSLAQSIIWAQQAEIEEMKDLLVRRRLGPPPSQSRPPASSHAGHGMTKSMHADHAGHGDHQHGDHADHGAGHETEGPPWAAEWDTAMAAMHEGMALPLTGDADVDFLLGMIPHHEGAIAMARIQSDHGSEAMTLGLAQEILVSQELEVGIMTRLLQDLGPADPGRCARS